MQIAAVKEGEKIIAHELKCACCGEKLKVTVEAFEEVIANGVTTRRPRVLEGRELYLAVIAAAVQVHNWRAPVGEMWCEACQIEWERQKRQAQGYSAT